jgi:hypothetical protein
VARKPPTSDVSLRAAPSTHDPPVRGVYASLSTKASHVCFRLANPPCFLSIFRARGCPAPFSTLAEFLRVAVRMLKVGGTLVYSTCTLTPEENEEQVASALRHFSCLRLVPALPRVGREGRPGLGLDDGQRRMVQRFEPAEQQCEGFFLAKFVKVGASEGEGVEIG